MTDLRSKFVSALHSITGTQTTPFTVYTQTIWSEDDRGTSAGTLRPFAYVPMNCQEPAQTMSLFLK